MTDLQTVDAWWRAANYLSVGQIYLMDNPLLRDSLRPEHIKPRLLGHWGTTPGLNFVHAHLNRLIRAREMQMLTITGPGHGGPAPVANAWLEGSYPERYPDVDWSEAGMRRLFRQFSFPGGVPSHAAPETPGSMHEGGELGYSLAHAHGAAFDTPDLTVACVIGDGEAETGPLAGSWQSVHFVDPRRDGAVLPILHLNGWKIAGPTVLARMSDDALDAFFRGMGYAPLHVGGSDPVQMHRDMAAALDAAADRLAEIRREAPAAPRWPIIVLRSPKGWTGPDRVDGKKVEGTFRAHQVPLPGVREEADHLAQLERWMRSYRPEELFTEAGPAKHLRALIPAPEARMTASPHAEGHRLCPLELPPVEPSAFGMIRPGAELAGATGHLGTWLRELFRRNPDRFRLFAPDETKSNRLDAVFEVTARRAPGPVGPEDEDVALDGRVMEVLSEHLCQGWMEGYTLTGRHGLFTSYEAFIHIVDSMFNQHAKWLRTIRRIDWRPEVPSFTYLLTSHVWRQDHNGFSHQDPGFLDHVANKKAEVVRLYLPPDANSLLAVAERCFSDMGRINVIVAGKQPEPQWLSLAAARAHLDLGFGTFDWISDAAPDVVLACAGDVPTLEAVAAAQLIRTHSDLRVRLVNVVDLMALQDPERHEAGTPNSAFAAAFTTDRPVVFAFHGYPGLIHRLTYRRPNHDNFHVHGYQEEGTTTTPFDMTVMNRLDRYHLALAAVKWTGADAPDLMRHCREALERHRDHVRAHGEDMPEIRDWDWSVPAFGR
ncbi:phosphoketolase family protein [Celeribacter indicus]|uniref:Phosphoketolase n=1 Tax=Celeribacter indicus TaxID=1208324 RepID=A0A0B5E174_9RHOB|nr:phosphoketolase family protein [Celeribacter indicus]AJE49039.1 phosphoketolase [Celeribacter indicus]SDW44366.1 xylulose-5-phosphate/fructose-6-phosphate phosphoketolase [Celeribacter indicus]